MYQFKKVDRYFRWGIRSFLAGGKKKLEKSSAVLLMHYFADELRFDGSSSWTFSHPRGVCVSGCPDPPPGFPSYTQHWL
jgi:hypothetical protein